MKIKYIINEQIKARDYLLSFYVSKSNIYKLFTNKQVYLNGNLINENQILNPNDILEIDYNESINYKPIDYNLDILYEDDYFLIINKPAKIIIHDDNDSLCNLVASYYIKNHINLSIKYAHRLDYDTTGVIIFCKDLLTLDYMNHFIETHDIKREYIALANNRFSKSEGTIDLNIGSDRHVNNKYIVSKSGKRAITHYEVIKNYKKYSLVKLILETGRTHQIRCHLAYINHPIIGDTLYGDKSNLSTRCLLHSSSVKFIHPVTKKEIIINTDIPEDIKKFLR